MNIVVYLQHKIDGFSSQPCFLSRLKSQFCNHSFVEVFTIEELEKSVSTCDLLITWVFKKEWYPQASRLRAIFTPAAGSDWVEYHPQSLVPVFHGAFHGSLIAEALLAMILFFNKRFEHLLNCQHKHIWDRNFMSYSRRLGEQNVILFGYGAIGRECARVLKTFGCTIIGVKRSPADPFVDHHADVIVKPEECQTHLSQANHIVSILPGSDSNDGFFGRDFWNAVNPEAYFYSLGRGNVCKESDLLWALDNKKISGAGLDVFEKEPLPSESRLWDYPGVMIMPHATALSAEYIDLYIPEIIKHLKPFLQ